MIQKKQIYKTFSSRLFVWLCKSTILLLFLDAVSWVFNGVSYWTQYISIWLFYFIEPIPLIIWLCYLDYHLNKSMKRLKQRWFYIQPIMLITILLIINIFTDFIYYIDRENMYQRGPGIVLVLAVNLAIILYTIGFATLRRNKLEKKVFSIIVMFSIFPVIGGIAQIFLYGVSILWNSVALSVIFIYLFLETQKEIKDYLTGLLNRQQIDDFIVSRMIEYGKKGAFSLVMLDIDNFKKINDTYGHKEGDRALVKLSEILYSCVKKIDKVARFGGDEFIILLEEETPSNIEDIIKRIHNTLAVDNTTGNHPYTLSVSVGFAVYSPKQHTSLQELLNQADEKMYIQKKSKA